MIAAAIPTRKSTARHLRVLLGPLGLLFFATSASAECAWVLWSVSATVVVATGETRALPAAWSPYAGFANAQACVTAQAAAMRDDQARGKDWSEVVQNVEVRHTFIYRCLPDTVDPRGPKGTK